MSYSFRQLPSDFIEVNSTKLCQTLFESQPSLKCNPKFGVTLPLKLGAEKLPILDVFRRLQTYLDGVQVTNQEVNSPQNLWLCY